MISQNIEFEILKYCFVAILLFCGNIIHNLKEYSYFYSDYRPWCVVWTTSNICYSSCCILDIEKVRLHDWFIDWCLTLVLAMSFM